MFNGYLEDLFREQPLTALEERQRLLAHHVRMVARSLSHALFVFGAQGGLGKSRTILGTLEEEGIEPLIVNSHCTPLSLYSTLYLYKDDTVIFFDDVDSMFSSMAHLGLLRSALWGNPRVITYGSSTLRELPPSFQFTSRCIFAANVIPRKNDAFKAMLSRCDVFELSATNSEVVDLMRSVSADGFRNLTHEDCNMVIDFIGDNSEGELSMRLLGPSLRKFQYARTNGLDWRPLVKSQLTVLGLKQPATKRMDSKASDVRVLKEALNRHPESVKDQQDFWCQTTAKSRASFYRILSHYRDQTEA
jgi:hypothetical protein